MLESNESVVQTLGPKWALWVLSWGVWGRCGDTSLRTEDAEHMTSAAWQEKGVFAFGDSFITT